MDKDTIEVTIEDFPTKIKEIRKQKSLTQKELAEKANVTQQTISALEKGKLDPSLKLLFVIAGILGVGFLIKSLIKKGGENNG